MFLTFTTIFLLLSVCVATILPSQFGTFDFVEYWAAYQLFREGHNPYDPNLLLQIQQRVMPERVSPLMMWNPPWLLVLLAPILSFEFGTAARIFLVFNLTCVLLTAYFLFANRRQSFVQKGLPIVVVVTFFPIWNALNLGQISILLMTLATGLVVLTNRGSPAVTGMIASLFSLKPHLFLVFGGFLVVKLLAARRFSFLYGVLAGLLLMVVAPMLISTEVNTQWIHAVTDQVGSNTNVVLPERWKTATLASLARECLAGYVLVDLKMLMALFPATGLLLALGLFKLHQLSSHERTVLALGLSVLFSPFGWIFDMALLIPLLYYVASRSVGLAMMFILLSATMFLVLSRYSLEHHHFGLVPLILVALCGLFIIYRTRQPEASWHLMSSKVN